MIINSDASSPAPAAVTSFTAQQPIFAQVQQNRALSEAVRLVNSSALTSQDRQLSLSLDPVTKIAVAKVVDQTTGEVFDQVPTEDILRLAAYLEAQSARDQVLQQNPQQTHG